MTVRTAARRRRAPAPPPVPPPRAPLRAEDFPELWLSDLPPGQREPGTPLVCPRCGGTRFAAEHTSFGLEMLCWKCPTFIAVATTPKEQAQ